jgi:hypothetical protein
MSLSSVCFNLERNEGFLESTCARCSLDRVLQGGKRSRVYLHAAHGTWVVVKHRRPGGGSGSI